MDSGTGSQPKKLSEERLAQLKLAREKAMEKRRMLGEISRAEKQMREANLNERLTKVREFKDKVAKVETRDSLSKVKTTKTEPKKSCNERKRCNERKHHNSESSESESSESESESESEDEIVYVPLRGRRYKVEKRLREKTTEKKPTEKKLKKSESQKVNATCSQPVVASSNTQDLAAIAKQRLIDKMSRDTAAIAFQSIFPGYQYSW